MYFPYFRGKQNELAAIRETAAIMARSDITPIIEPVKSQLNPLKKALDAIVEENGAAIVIINPKVGDLAGNGGAITRRELPYRSSDYSWYSAYQLDDRCGCNALAYRSSSPLSSLHTCRLP